MDKKPASTSAHRQAPSAKSLRRILEIHRLLQERRRGREVRPVNAGTLARAFEVAEKTIQRDLARMATWLALPRSALLARKLSLLGMCITGLTIMTYWFLGMSSLNVWRA